MSRSALFTHNDLDGLVCALLYRVAYPDGRVYFCHYDGLDQLFARHVPRYDVVWVADLSLKSGSGELKALRESGAEVHWFDHHVSSEDQPWMAECVIDRTGCFCAADMVNAAIERSGHEAPAPWQTLIEWAHDQDLWIRKIPESQTFNDIFGHMMVQQLFDELSGDPLKVYDFSPCMRNASEQTLAERELSRKLAENSATITEVPGVGRLKSVCCWGSVSEVGDMVGDPETLVALLDLKNLERGEIRFSFRTQSNTINASAVAETLGGGGHAKAAGASLSVDILKALTNEVARRVAAAVASQADDKEQ